jgi:hypothetical protein
MVNGKINVATTRTNGVVSGMARWVKFNRPVAFLFTGWTSTARESPASLPPQTAVISVSAIHPAIICHYSSNHILDAQLLACVQNTNWRSVSRSGAGGRKWQRTQTRTPSRQSRWQSPHRRTCTRPSSAESSTNYHQRACADTVGQATNHDNQQDAGKRFYQELHQCYIGCPLEDEYPTDDIPK